MSNVKDYSQFKNSKGHFIKGNPGGGRTVGALSHKGMPKAIYKSIGKRRGDLELWWQDWFEENKDMISEKLLELCNDKDSKTLLHLFSHMVSRPKEFEETKDILDNNKGESELLEELSLLQEDLEKRKEMLANGN